MKPLFHIPCFDVVDVVNDVGCCSCCRKADVLLRWIIRLMSAECLFSHPQHDKFFVQSVFLMHSRKYAFIIEPTRAGSMNAGMKFHFQVRSLRSPESLASISPSSPRSHPCEHTQRVYYSIQSRPLTVPLVRIHFLAFALFFHSLRTPSIQRRLGE